MPDRTIVALKQAIGKLEQDLARYRQALQVLESLDAGVAPSSGGTRRARASKGTMQRKTPVQAPTPARTQTAGTSRRRTRLAKNGQAKTTRGTPQSSTSQLIRGVLSEASSALTPAEIVSELARRGHRVPPGNVHRRLSDMAKANLVTRSAGKYAIGK
jgi:hypothetical protein